MVECLGCCFHGRASWVNSGRIWGWRLGFPINLVSYSLVRVLIWFIELYKSSFAWLYWWILNDFCRRIRTLEQSHPSFFTMMSFLYQSFTTCIIILHYTHCTVRYFKSIYRQWDNSFALWCTSTENKTLDEGTQVSSHIKLNSGDACLSNYRQIGSVAWTEQLWCTGPAGRIKLSLEQ